MPKRKKTKSSRRTIGSGTAWREYTKPALILLAIGLGFGLFVLIVYDPLVPGEQMIGTIEKVSTPQAGPGTEQCIDVRLITGGVVQVYASSLETFTAGQQVTLQERTGRIFGKKDYKFIGVTEKTP